MSKLLEDPKVAALVEKSVAAAVKTERKRVLEIVKLEKTKATEAKDKVGVTYLKFVEAGIKVAA